MGLNNKIMNRYIFFICILAFQSSVFAQKKTSGTITYERQESWSKIMSQMPYLSQEEKDRIAITNSRNTNEFKETYELYFTPEVSFYQQKQNLANESSYRYSWRNSMYVIYRNFKEKKVREWHEMLDKIYLCEDDLIKPVWKIGNEIKDVNGYLCMKAETRDTVKNQTVVAWFTDQILTEAGPEAYFGLPGAIMELNINGGSATITAVSVRFSEEPREINFPKSKAKKVNYSTLNKAILKFMNSSIQAQKNPFRSLRY